MTLCVVGQADDFFVLARTQTKDWARDIRRDQKWKWKGRSERSQRGSWQRNPKGAVVKGNQRGWVSDERRGEAVENGHQSRWVSSPEYKGGSEQDGQRLVGIPSDFCMSFAKNTLPAIVYKMHEKLYKKCHRTTLLALGANLSPYCSFVLFLPFPCGRKEMRDTPVGTHWMNHRPWIVLVLRSWCIRDSRRGIITTVFDI